MHCLSGEAEACRIYFYWHLVHAARVRLADRHPDVLERPNISNHNKLSVSAIELDSGVL